MSPDFDIASHLQATPGIWRGVPGAEGSVLKKLSASAPIPLPSEYLELLAASNGGEGDLAIEPGWFCPWPAEEVLEQNEGYEIATYAPDLFGIGSNGGGELIAIDHSTASPFAVVMVPFIPLDRSELQMIAQSMSEFVQLIGVEIPEA